VPAFDYDVVIPTHGKRFDLLLEAIASVEAQAVAARSIIVVVDAVPEVADRLRQERPQVRTLCLEQPGGDAGARQRGIDESTAEWVCFLDDDDLWATDKQAAIAEYLTAHPECQALCAGYWTFTGAGSASAGINGQEAELRGDSLTGLETSARSAKPVNNLDYLGIRGDSIGCLLEYNRGNIGTATIRRTILQQARPVPPGLRPGGDHLLFCAVADLTDWHLLRRRLLFYRLHEGQDTRRTDPSAGRSIMASRRLAWDWLGAKASRPLASYGPLYRQELRRFLWPLLRAGELREARRTYEASKPLLPRRRDRVLALVPEPVVWRLRHQVLGPFRPPEAATSPTW
jgi:glycosyltransferase involved in cell wall biosynthesis